VNSEARAQVLSPASQITRGRGGTALREGRQIAQAQDGAIIELKRAFVIRLIFIQPLRHLTKLLFHKARPEDAEVGDSLHPILKTEKLINTEAESRFDAILDEYGEFLAPPLRAFVPKTSA
jgi:hypothetical protein